MDNEHVIDQGEYFEEHLNWIYAIPEIVWDLNWNLMNLEKQKVQG